MSGSTAAGLTPEDDLRFMRAAVRLARHHSGWTATNPSVACLLVRDDGEGPYICGRGVTARGGRPHAEPIAILEAGEKARGATAYVTLEPCAHHGGTPPCAQNLIDGGVARVVTAVIDPDPRVNDRGHAMLRQAGISVIPGTGRDDALRDLSSYLTHKQWGRPEVTLKLAVSADNHIGVHGRGGLQITGEGARAQSHMLRARHHAILVGSRTVAEDDPLLNCRLPGLEGHSPVRIVLDSSGRLTGAERIVQTARQWPCWIAAPALARNSALTEAGCTMLACEVENGRVVLPELLEDLAARGIMSLLVEGGAAVAQSFLAGNLVDRIALFVAPAPLGGEGGALVSSPLPPSVLQGTPPPGFAAAGEWHFGEDRLLCFTHEER